MSWIAPTLLRRYSAWSPAQFIGGARFSSQLSSTPSLIDFNIGDALEKAVQFNGSLSARKSPADLWAAKSNSLTLSAPPNTWTGRRVVVRNGDLHNTFQYLNHRLRQNFVAKEIALTVRHEKKGDKRARLRSERWRKRFADAVRKKVQLVSTIRRRGG